MSNPNRRGPRALSEILGELFTVRGYGRLRASGELEEVWNTAVGEPSCHQTRIGDVRRGVLSVTVSHPTLLEELAAFRKAELLQALCCRCSGNDDPRHPVPGWSGGCRRPRSGPAPPPASETPAAGARKPPGPAARGEAGREPSPSRRPGRRQRMTGDPAANHETTRRNTVQDAMTNNAYAVPGRSAGDRPACPGIARARFGSRSP